MVRSWLVCFLALLSGCIAAPTLHTAQPVGRGNLEAAVAVNVLNSPDWTGPIPVLDVALRRGMTDWLDMGLRLSLNGFGVSFDVNALAYSGPSLALSVDPAITLSIAAKSPDVAGYDFPDGVKNATFWVPLLLDVLRTQHIGLTVGGRVGYNLAGTLSGLVYGPLALVRIRLDETFALQPEGYASFKVRAFKEAAGTLSLIVTF